MAQTFVKRSKPHPVPKYKAWCAQSQAEEHKQAPRQPSRDWTDRLNWQRLYPLAPALSCALGKIQTHNCDKYKHIKTTASCYTIWHQLYQCWLIQMELHFSCNDAFKAKLRTPMRKWEYWSSDKARQRLPGSKSGLCASGVSVCVVFLLCLLSVCVVFVLIRVVLT